MSATGARPAGPGLVRAARAAAAGVAWAARTQPNVRIHAVSTVLVLVGAALLPATGPEFLALLLAIGLVWVAELVNTAVEAALDAVHPEHDPLVGHAKDAAAGAVLAAALVALGVAVTVAVRHAT